MKEFTLDFLNVEGKALYFEWGEWLLTVGMIDAKNFCDEVDYLSGKV